MKIKCDRKFPCSHCIKTGVKCDYGSVGDNKSSTPSTSDHPSPSQYRIDQLEDQISQMKVQLNALSAKAGIFKSDDDEKSVLDVKMPYFKITGMSSKPSRTIYAGPLSQLCLAISPTLMRYIMASLKSGVDQTRTNYKRQHRMTRSHIYLLRLDIDEDVLIKQIECIICPNFFAFQERLTFFQGALNNLLYNNSVPMASILMLFMSYFRNPEIVGEVKFVKPEKPFYYADISVMIGIVVLTTLFTRFNSHGKQFSHQLTATLDQLITLQATLLNKSDFRRKKTHFGLLSLEMLRDSILVYDNTEGANSEYNSITIYQIELGICYQMGLQRNPESITIHLFKKKGELRLRSLNHDEAVKFWNYMIIEDAMYSGMMGSPLLIDERFCEPYTLLGKDFAEIKIKEGTHLLRKICLKVNSFEELSIRQVLNLDEDAINYCHKLPSSMLTSQGDRTNDLDDLAHLFKMKFMFLNIIQSLDSIIIKGIISMFKSKSPLLKNSGTRNLLIKLARKSFLETLFAAEYSLFHMKRICDGKSVFGKELDSPHIIYFRFAFCKIVHISATTVLSFAISKGTKNSKIVSDLNSDPIFCCYPPDAPNSKVPINESTIEDALFSKFSKYSFKEMEELAYKILKPAVVAKFCTDLYHSAVVNQSISQSMDGIMGLTAMIMCVSSMRAIEETPPNSGSIPIQKLIQRTKEILETEVNSTGINSNPSFTLDDFNIEKMFNTLLADGDLLTLIDDLEDDSETIQTGSTDSNEYADIDPYMHESVQR